MFIARIAFASVLLMLCGAVSTAQKGKEYDFGDFNVKFAVPAGWKVLKTEKKKDSAFIVLQETVVAKGAKSKAVMGIWMGKKYIADAPAAGNVKAGNDASGALLATRRLLSYAAGTPERLAPLQSDDVVIGFALGDNTQITLEYQTKTQSVYGFGSAKREGGEMTAAAVADADPVALEKVRGTLNDLIGFKNKKK